jgi:hypothetical protein
MKKTVEGMMLGIIQQGLFGGKRKRPPKYKPEPSELDKSRTRWLRWLAQVCRIDREGWTELLSANYIGWVARVMGEDYEAMPFTTPREKVVEAFTVAIRRADEAELRALDMLYAEKLLEKRTGHRK